MTEQVAITLIGAASSILTLVITSIFTYLGKKKAQEIADQVTLVDTKVNDIVFNRTAILQDIDEQVAELKTFVKVQKDDINARDRRKEDTLNA